MADDYAAYSVTINGQEHSIKARGWYYTHAVAIHVNGKWQIERWCGAREGDTSRGQEIAERAVQTVRNTYKNMSHRVVAVGQSYQF
jgi:hypothetical protein